MAKLTNGNIPNKLLVQVDVDPKHRLLYTTAVKWKNTVAEVQRKYGWTPQPSVGWTCYRPHFEQVTLFSVHYTPNYNTSAKFDRRVWNGISYWRRKGNTVAAAVPGTSNHGWGGAIDVRNLEEVGSTKFNEFASVAVLNGLSHDEGAAVGEPWHWRDPETVTQVNNGIINTDTVPSVTVPTLPVAPQPTNSKDEEMISSITYLYAALEDRVPSFPEVDGWLSPERTDRELTDAFLGVKPNRNSVIKAYKDAGLSPDEEGIKYWLTKPTIKEVRAGIAYAAAHQ